MNSQKTLQSIIHFPLTKIVIGIVVVVASVAFGEWIRNALLDKTAMPGELKNLIVAIIQSLLALLSYVLLFRFYEKRPINELSAKSFWKNALTGFLLGLFLQTLFVLFIYLADGYSVTTVNPVSFLLPSFATALTAGFVAEILIRGILFRVMEEKLGTLISLIITASLFAVIHLASKEATLLSILSTTIQAGLLLSAAYVCTRSLWLPIFFHFAWDFAEPGIYGAINPSITIEESLFTSKITGPILLTGGGQGPQSSIQAIILCLMTALFFLWLAKRKNNFIKPYWKR